MACCCFVLTAQVLDRSGKAGHVGPLSMPKHLDSMLWNDQNGIDVSQKTTDAFPPYLGSCQMTTHPTHNGRFK